jgi:glycosyltransferase involved in cell wall biosynthesis
MTPRRILHCIPGMGGGGAERQLAYLTRELVQLGWDVHVALVSGGPNYQRLEEAGGTIHLIEARNNYDPGILWRLARTIDRVKPDLVQVWMLQMEILGALAARVRGVPWILSERCSEPAYPPTFKNWIRQRMAASANVVVSNSGGGRQYWDVRLDARTAQYVIPNALPLEEIGAIRPADAQQTGLAPGETLVLFAGRLTEQKDPESVLAALATVLQRPQTVAVIAGDGPLRATLVSLAQQRGIHTRVRFPGYLENLWAWMKRASVFVSPSLFEGHPNTVLEAAACGCPLIVSDIPAHREFLDDRSALFVPTAEPDDLARAIAGVLDDPEAARARAARAANTVAQWSAARIAKQYEQVYVDLLDRLAGESLRTCAGS